MEEEASIIKNYNIYNYEHSYKIYNEKYEYYSLAIEKLTKIKSMAEKFLKEKIENIKVKKDVNTQFIIEDNYMSLIILIKDEMILNINASLSTINEIIKNLLKLKEIIKSNNKNFTDYINIKNSYNIKLTELQNYKNKYYTTAEKAENYTLDFIDKKMNNNQTEPDGFEKKKKLQNSCKEEKEKYISKIKEINELIKPLNEKQENIFNINKKIEKNIYDKYLNNLFSFYQNVSEGPEGVEKKQNVKDMILEVTSKSEKIDELKYKEEKKIEFIQYKSKIDFDNCYDNVLMGVYITTCEEMQKVIGNYIDEELKKYKQKTELNNKLKKIIYTEDKMTEEEEKEIYSALDTTMGQKLFINNLSLLRTSGKLQKSQKFIKIMGNALNKLIHFEKINNDYTQMQSCLILSQTFYYLDLNNEKKYIFEYIANNKWIKSPNFWRNFIESMLQIELQKTNINRIQINDLLHSQFMPYIKNMKEFKIDDRIIIKIIDELLEKYNYSENKKYGPLFIFVNNDPKEIEKLRKEYKENPDLENQLYKENVEENENINDNDKEINNEEKSDKDKVKEKNKEHNKEKDDEDDKDINKDKNSDEDDTNKIG